MGKSWTLQLYGTGNQVASCFGTRMAAKSKYPSEKSELKWVSSRRFRLRNVICLLISSEMLTKRLATVQLRFVVRENCSTQHSCLAKAQLLCRREGLSDLLRVAVSLLEP